MPVKHGQHIIRTLPVVVTITNGDGILREETLTIRYNPVTQGWIDKWRDLAAEDAKDVALKMQKAQSRYAAREKELEKTAETAEGDALVEAERQLETLRRKFASEIDGIRKSSRRNYLAKQLSELLVDVDHLDEEDKPILPTEQFLAGLDLELLEDIQAGIEKKVFRRATT